MRFFSDQDVYHITIGFLRDRGHDVLTARELNMSRAADEELLIKAKEMNRILITRDKDFGALVFLNKIQTGVILLRMTPTTVEDAHQQLIRLLDNSKEDELLMLFSIVEPNRYRLRNI